ncbi:alkaline shock response membrane anchor protein AmaP [Streptomyces sp. NPDC086787]|uniref:alkaline shock response membrane anchor protein AmaP n=1 Tax=Streptomyces sp. NPDC086787 TaxID=3365759 RepID=UPI003830F518
MRPVLRTVNRILIGVAGLLLAVVGGSVLAVGLGVRPPAWWIHDGPHDVLLTQARRTRWQDNGWWWPAVLGALGVLVLLALWWLTAVLRRRRLGEFLVETGDDGAGVLLRGRAFEDALADDAAGLDGVAYAQVTLTGGRHAPGARVRLQLEPYADPGTVLRDLTARSLAHARESAGLAGLPTEVRLRTVKHRAERVT